MAQTEIAERVFAAEDQAQFAAISGDYNPLHMDASAARRTIAGRPVVHGIHTVLWGIDNLYRKKPDLPLPQSIKVRFDKAIHLGDRVKAVWIDDGRLDVIVDGVNAARMSLAFGARQPVAVPDPFGPAFAPVQPRDMTFEQAILSQGRISLAPAAPAADIFPAAASIFGAGRIAWLVRSSYLVGMVCPGLHSLYGGFNIMATDVAENSDNLDFRVVGSDPRFGLIKLAVAGGGWVGTLDTYARSAPAVQSPMSAVSERVRPGEFQGKRALVVGGSRGVGEVVVKILAAGGAHVTATYATGADDARKVQAEIRESGGHCDLMRYDARLDAGAQLSDLKAFPDQVYYLATPQIFRRKAAGFARDRFEDFLAFYVTGFYGLCRELKLRSGKAAAIFYPSSVSVETRPANMTEYTMAKAAGEILCADMQAFEQFGPILVSRLPRLHTDQTSGILQSSRVDPVSVMLPLVRELNALRARI